MQCTFIGHQSWLLSYRDTHILIDPILENQFGHCGMDFQVYPPRQVDAATMPKPSAVILSHEHLDHFHLPSLHLLPRDVPIIVGALMPRCVTRAVRALGFEVREVPLETALSFDALQITLYPGAHETAFWEKRVTQIHAVPTDRDGGDVFIAVDALLSESYANRVRTEELAPPNVLVISNNSQYPPPGAIGAYSNLLPLPEQGRVPGNFPGLSILHSLLLRYVDVLGDSPYIAICGNGFVSGSDAFGPFLFSDNHQLAQLANALTLTPRAFGPRPGERLAIGDGPPRTDRVAWITPDDQRKQELLTQQQEFLDRPAPPPFQPVSGEYEHPREIRTAVKRVRQELEHMARALMVSKVGALALAVNHYLSGPLGPRRILFSFIESADGPAHQFALDLAESRFVRDDTPPDRLLETFPFGIQVHLKDFCAVLDGELQIWDLAGVSMRSWYLGDVYENVVVFLFEYFGEQVRPDLASRVYNRVVERLLAD